MKDNTNTQQYTKLISDFFEGKTSLDQERRLYAFFQTGDVPPELEPYRKMFTAFGSLDYVRTADVTDDSAVKPRPRTRYMRNLWLTISGAAAAVMIVIGSMAAYDYAMRQEAERIYAGSYVIINGQRINDIDRIRPFIEQSLSEAETIERQADINNDIKKAENELLEQFDSDEERRQIEQLLKE